MLFGAQGVHRVCRVQGVHHVQGVHRVQDVHRVQGVPGLETVACQCPVSLPSLPLYGWDTKGTQSFKGDKMAQVGLDIPGLWTHFSWTDNGCRA